jgi:hypothetical protein
MRPRSLLVSANIPPAKDPKQSAIEEGLRLYGDLLERVRHLELALIATQAVFALRIAPEPDAARSLLQKVLEETESAFSQERSELLTALELARLLSRKADPLKPDA